MEGIFLREWGGNMIFGKALGFGSKRLNIFTSELSLGGVGGKEGINFGGKAAL